MRGTVLQYDDNAGSGYISGDDGIRYTFKRSDLQQLRPISAGMKVDFVPNAGRYLSEHRPSMAPEPVKFLQLSDKR